MDDIEELTNGALLKAIGENLEKMRIESRIPDAEVIRRGGIKKDSWYSLKSGGNITLINLVKALRGLDRLEAIGDLISHESEGDTPNQPRNGKAHLRKRFHNKKIMPHEES